MRNPFVAPVISERQDKQVSYTDSRSIFEHIKTNKDHMSFEDATRLLNDLAFVLIPFDRTQNEF